MNKNTLPVVPSSWEEGLGVVEKNNEKTYYTPNIYNKSNLICRYHPLPLLPEGGDYKMTPFSIVKNSPLPLLPEHS
jgi:hypothetical protein